MKEGELVEVLWRDTISSAEWVHKSALKWSESRVATVGYFLREDEDTVALADSLFSDFHDEDGMVGGVTEIPRGMILEIRAIRREMPNFSPPAL